VVLSIFPALVVVVSLLGVFGEGKRTTDTLLQLVGDLGPRSTVDTLRAPIQQLVESPSAGLALPVGIMGAVWSASGYVGALGRAMNRIYEIEEGRPVWKLRPRQLLITLGGLVLAAAAAFLLAVSGPLASAVGSAIGVGDVALTAWSIARWPIIVIFMTLAVATLYYATPNRPHRASASPACQSAHAHSLPLTAACQTGHAVRPRLGVAGKGLAIAHVCGWWLQVGADGFSGLADLVEVNLERFDRLAVRGGGLLQLLESVFLPLHRFSQVAFAPLDAA
jgi:YihY family inner membrane protein